MRAVYKDTQGIEYSAPVVRDSDKWAMETSDGLVPIAYIFKDDRAGRLTFSHYRDDQPTPSEPDTRLHIEPKQPGQSSLAQLQAAAAKQVAQALADRQHRRQEILNDSAKRDAAKIAETRAINNQLANRLKPKREIIPPTELTQEHLSLAEQARWRKRKIEPES